MGFDIAAHNQEFLTKAQNKEPVYNDASTYSVDIKFLPSVEVPESAKQYWHVIGVHHLTGAENWGNHHIFCDVLDENGKRINGARLTLMQGSSLPVFAVVDKPANEPGTNFPLWKADRATVAITWPDTAPLPSEQIVGLSSAHPDEQVGNTLFHHSFYVVFQRTAIPEQGEPPVTHGGVSTTLSLEDTIKLVGQPQIIPLNPDAMFYKVAKENELGERLTAEYDLEYEGKAYRAQIFEKGIVYAPVGEWNKTAILPRVN